MTILFQCDYCGRLSPMAEAILAWTIDEDRTGPEPDDKVATVVITCNISCAELVNSLSVRRWHRGGW